MTTSQKQAARKFVEYWTFQRGSEKGEDQQFWNSLLGEVLGMADVKSRIKYQVPVQLKDTTKFLDAWIPETRVLIEHKSRGVNLDAPQTGHGGLTPYEQAVEYDNARPFDEKARWIVTCNFDEFRIYDRAKPLAPPMRVGLGDLPKEAHRLAFLVNPKEKAIDRELEISVQAGRIVGEIYDALLKQYNEGSLLSLRGDSESRSLGEDSKKSPSLQNSMAPSSESNYLAALNRLCVRLVFCLYAEDADIFPKDCFKRPVEATPAPFLRERLIRLFQVLDTPIDKRNVYLEPELCVFPYTNGGLFKTGTTGILPVADDIPPLTEEIRQLLIGASQFDWREITPTIFGALFESTLNPVTRRAGGMVYTSVENIHKVIDPLFLDDLTRRVEAAIHKGDKRTLLALQAEMAALTFLDPACGSGNFLTETYICLRRLENRIIAALQRGQAELYLDDTGGSPSSATANRVKVSIAQFHGIEINDFAVAVAKTALWIAEAQMLRETAEILHREPDYLPLHDYANIAEGNALRMDWGDLLTGTTGVPPVEANGQDARSPSFDYIIGNPPFRGARNKSDEQAADMEAVFGKDWKGLGNLDYVTAWYKKAAEMKTRCAFVSTNSICQGDGVAALWKPLMEKYGVEIDFAWRTFRWDNETMASEKAHVHCVIVGFHAGGRTSSSAVSAREDTRPPKRIFDNGRTIPADHINAYLAPGPDAYAESRARACSAPHPLVFGSMPNDGGNLSNWSDAARAELLSRHPAAEPLFRRIVGSHEAINKVSRWCLWLKGVSPAAIRAVPPVVDAVAKVRELRLASNRAATRKLADTPTLFGEIRQPESGNYLLIPKVSSERREYIPMAFMSADVIASDLCLIVPGATLYDFGVLTSSVHMAWMRAVAGRLEMRYRYSAAIVYNNFPWPTMMGNNRDNGKNNFSSEPGATAPGDKNAARLRGDEKEVVFTSCPSCFQIEKTAKAILDARARYPESSLADLYDPLTMPADLRAAHTANDRAVLAAYGLKPDTPEPEIAAHLFKLYAEKASEAK